MNSREIQIPDNWILVNFGDKILFEILGSGITFFENEKDYYSTSSIEVDKFIEVEQVISYRNRPSRANMQPVPNSVWFAKMKNTLKVIQPDQYQIDNVIFSTGFCGIKANNIDCSFLFQVLKSEDFNTKKDNLAEGTTQVAVNNQHVRNIEFLLPCSILEQQKIASILSKLDEAITQTEQLIEKYKKIKEGLMHDLLTRGIDEHGNIRSEETHKFKDSPLGRIPVEWNIVKLKHFGSKYSPYLKTGPFGSSLKTEHWRETGVPVITIGSLGDNDFILKNLLYVSETKSQELESYKLQDGDILFSRVADVGRSLVINKNTEGWIMSSNFMRLRLDKNMVIPDFLHLILKNSYAFKKQVFESVNENGRTVTNSKILNEFDFIFVPFDEQKNIVKIKEKIDIDVNSIIQQLDKLQLQKSGLMHDLLTGKIRVQI